MKALSVWLRRGWSMPRRAARFLLSVCMMVSLQGWPTDARAAEPGEGFFICMEELGALLFGEPGKTLSKSLLQGRLPNCAMMHVPGNEIPEVAMSEFAFTLQRAAAVSAEKRRACHETWSEDWGVVRDRVRSRDDWGSLPFVAVSDPNDELSPLEQEIFYRAEFERDASRLAEERKISGQLPPGECYWTWTAVGYARLENAGFFSSSDLLSAFENGKIGPKVTPEFWLMIQHADILPNFQFGGFVKLYDLVADRDFPEVLLSSMVFRMYDHYPERFADWHETHELPETWEAVLRKASAGRN